MSVLIQKLTELSKAMSGSFGRHYDGPFDPPFPRLVFEVIWKRPLRSNLDPLETYGEWQRMFHSKDGKYWHSFLGQSEVRRSEPQDHDKRIIADLREVREMVRRDRQWCVIEDPTTGSWFPKSQMHAPGILIPAIALPKLVPFDEFTRKLDDLMRANDYRLLNPANMTHEESEQAWIEIQANGPAQEALKPGDVLCTLCGAQMTPTKLGETEAFECKKCETFASDGPGDLSEPLDGDGDWLKEILEKIREEFDSQGS